MGVCVGDLISFVSGRRLKFLLIVAIAEEMKILELVMNNEL